MTVPSKKKLPGPFDCLKKLLDPQTLPDKATGRDRSPMPAAPDREPLEEKRLFMDAMKGVEPISRDNCPPEKKPCPADNSDSTNEDAEVVLKLKRLVQSGTGFVVADTSEYIEGSGYLAPPEITTRLHRGDFSIQDHLDLHGLTAVEAEVAFEDFLRKSIGAGKRSLLIIHGRGLSSPAQPVLKTKVYQWLTRGHWRKWVIAFTSARSCDGGTGASYVLLRQRAVTKSQRKNEFSRRSADQYKGDPHLTRKHRIR